MNNLPLGWIIAGYIVAVLVTCLFLTGPISDLLEKDYSWLIDKKWKRIAWLLSSFLFLPYSAFLLLAYSFFAEEIKYYLSGCEREDGVE